MSHSDRETRVQSRHGPASLIYFVCQDEGFEVATSLPASNPNRDTAYTEGFRDFLQSYLADIEIGFKIGYDHFRSHSSHLLIYIHATIQQYELCI
jgi:hypothetical protein